MERAERMRREKKGRKWVELELDEGKFVCDVVEQMKGGKEVVQFVNVLQLSPKLTKQGKFVIFVLVELTHMLFSYYHEPQIGGHMGRYRTVHRVQELFIWFSMKELEE
ncbi:hypothetical protein PR048_018455 [Dryococelus australis]|uniref:Integrase zinc-binding domain-containing protein n=1 Tax=Dryococelus australis TaxID=614101 RepID=A0ABQ9HCC0_9NEOP|nr:hypothetical protein PR048_018455 [Dryococelus australis]